MSATVATPTGWRAPATMTSAITPVAFPRGLRRSSRSGGGCPALWLLASSCDASDTPETSFTAGSTGAVCRYATRSSSAA